MVKKGLSAAVNQARTCNDKENRPLPNAAAPSTGNDLEKILDFIEGRTQIQLAPKKADKRARQRQKKEEERKRREDEARAAQKAEEERLERERVLSEQTRIREELALQKALKQKKKAASGNGKKTKKGKEDVKCAKHDCKEVEFNGELFEQTIPAMVTIKRMVENNNAPPTVTITLKGSTPDQDKLLYTLVNGHDSPIFSSTYTKDGDKSKESKTSAKKKKKKAKDVQETNKHEPHVQTSEIQVNFAIDKSFRHDMAKLTEAKEAKTGTKAKKSQANQQQVKNCKTTQRNVAENDIIDIPSLKLPPGITITKVNGPLSNRKTNVQSNNKYPNVPVSKSGVIVVDTEKLMISQTGSNSNKKNKKKKGKKSAAMDEAACNVKNEPRVQIRASLSPTSSSGMVKLKNPIFHSLPNKLIAPDDALPQMMNMNEQATISKGENGMVTIRRQRHVGFYASNESSISEYLASKGQEGPREPILTPWQMPDMSIAAMSDENKILGPAGAKIAQWSRAEHDGSKLNASNVLQGLPGIEITRVKSGTTISASEYVEAPADVSIIRTSTFDAASAKHLT